MSDPRIGRIARALRHRLGWRQSDVARRAAVSQDAVSRTERGLIDGMTVGKVRQILAALGADLTLIVRWRGGDLDRLLDEGHATLVGAVTELLIALGWIVQIEVSFAVFGERGSIDVMAWHSATGTLGIGEVKTEIASVEETLRRHDVKVRLGASVASERFGWRPRTVVRLLIAPDSSTVRRRIGRHEVIFRRAYPVRGTALRAWLRQPTPIAGGLLFLSPTQGARGIRHPLARKRVRRSPASSGRSAGRYVDAAVTGYDAPDA